MMKLNIQTIVPTTPQLFEIDTIIPIQVEDGVFVGVFQKPIWPKGLDRFPRSMQTLILADAGWDKVGTVEIVAIVKTHKDGSFEPTQWFWTEERDGVLVATTECTPQEHWDVSSQWDQDDSSMLKRHIQELLA